MTNATQHADNKAIQANLKKHSEAPHNKHQQQGNKKTVHAEVMDNTDAFHHNRATLATDAGGGGDQ
eukprot:6401756-Ditylum_brightwellii.AAC.1